VVGATVVVLQERLEPLTLVVAVVVVILVLLAVLVWLYFHFQNRLAFLFPLE
jgi:cytoskeletal protein RodZ